MVKSIVSSAGAGFRDWMIQRVSAILMTIYAAGIGIYVAYHYPLTYEHWIAVFTPEWMKIAFLIFLLSLLSHAWVGIWTVVTDYISCYCLRIIFHIGVLLTLFSCFIWGLRIVWGI